MWLDDDHYFDEQHMMDNYYANTHPLDIEADRQERKALDQMEAAANRQDDDKPDGFEEAGVEMTLADYEKIKARLSEMVSDAKQALEHADCPYCHGYGIVLADEGQSLFASWEIKNVPNITCPYCGGTGEKPWDAGSF